MCCHWSCESGWIRITGTALLVWLLPPPTVNLPNGRLMLLLSTLAASARKIHSNIVYLKKATQEQKLNTYIKAETSVVQSSPPWRNTFLLPTTSATWITLPVEEEPPLQLQIPLQLEQYGRARGVRKQLGFNAIDKVWPFCLVALSKKADYRR